MTRSFNDSTMFQRSGYSIHLWLAVISLSRRTFLPFDDFSHFWKRVLCGANGTMESLIAFDTTMMT